MNASQAVDRIRELSGAKMVAAVNEFPDYYVTDLGTIWSTKRRIPVTVKPWPHNRSGHYMLSLVRDGRRHTRTLHVLVAKAFLRPRVGDEQVCHRDDNKADNRLANLYIGSREDNRRDAHRNQRYAKGDAHPQAILSEAAVREMRTAYSNGEATIRALAETFGATYFTTWAVVSRRTWKHV